MAFDFEWANANLFSERLPPHLWLLFGLGTFLAKAKPPTRSELALLGDAAAGLARRHARRQLCAAGERRLGPRPQDSCARRWPCWRRPAGRSRIRASSTAAGEPFAFTISMQNKDQEKIALHYQRTLQQIGIDGRSAHRRLGAIRQRMQKTYDYDMIPATWFNSLSPGNEQKFYYGSRGPDHRGHAQLSGHRRSGRRHGDRRAAHRHVAGRFRRRRARARPAAGGGLLHRALLRFGRAMGGALEAYRQAGRSSRCPASRRRRCGAMP